MPPSILRRHPFLALGILGLLLFGLWLALGAPTDGGVGTALFYSWRVLAAPVHLAANLLAPVTDKWPDVLDAAAVVIAGLAPCAAADWIVRRWRRRFAPNLHITGSDETQDSARINAAQLDTKRCCCGGGNRRRLGTHL
jgi:hypothetical protein